MKLWVRRTLATLVAVATCAAALVWWYIGDRLLRGFASYHASIGGPISQAPGPRTDLSVEPYYWLLGTLILITGCVAGLGVLMPRIPFRHRAWLYVLVLLVMIPITMLNYDQGDIVLARWAQVGVNLLLIFLATSVVWWLSALPAEAPDAKVLKYMTMTGLVTVGVCVPALFTILWFFVKIRLVTYDQNRAIPVGAVSAISSVIGVVFSWLNYRRENQKGSESDPRKNLVLP